MLKRRLLLLMQPLWRILLRLVFRIFDPGDPWEKTPREVPNRSFGAGLDLDFGRYLAGRSSVLVFSLDELCVWLRGCTYVPDLEQFACDDAWQHPHSFELTRRGDCEDHALWAWKRLIELGYEAEFVTGRWREPWDKPGRHAWVVFKQEERLFLLESVNKHGHSIIRPLEEVGAEYLPEVSVDHKLQRYAYNGYLHYLRIVVNKPAPKPVRAA